MTEREKELREFGFRPVEDPELIKAHQREDEKVVSNVVPIISALIDWRERSKNEIVCRV